MFYSTMIDQTPIGPLTLISDEHYIIRLDFGKKKNEDIVKTLTISSESKCLLWDRTPVMEQAIAQLMEYFEGRRKTFDLPLKLVGTEFQKKCWLTLAEIPYGETWSYRQLAEAIERPRAFRAVGQSNHRNPIPVILPCHRVIGSDGSLVGFGGGLDIKRTLLQIERDHR